MKMSISVIILLVSAVWWGCCAKTFKISVGGSVDIRCDYSKDFEVLTVFLKKISTIKNVTLIESGKEEETKGRYSLYHDSANRYFTVTIRNLSSEDAGAYRCGPNGYDIDDNYINTVHLEVEQTTPEPPLTTSSTLPHSTPTGRCKNYTSTQYPYR
ncbi:hypothetical protein ACEWY4_026432 [Coilia grayii]|uniref:Immunoglobulin domain-containing protein n=1 Tax=Coilia grayii TaxID=363190 RepID=A0ABD1IV77_9TELE